MYNGKKPFIIFCLLLFIFTLLTATGGIVPGTAQAQYWAAMPPYNVMWPLWSPALSPIDPFTGVPVPVVTSLTQNTILPVQPALAWDPCQPNVEGFPWLLYNTPSTFGGGLVYWDVYYGLNPWPPGYLLDPVIGTPAPITLPAGWSVISPIALDHFDWFVPMGNAIFSLRYGVPLSNLLTTAEIWGFPPLATLPAPIF